MHLNKPVNRKNASKGAMVGTETLNLFQWSGWRPKTHSNYRINCEIVKVFFRVPFLLAFFDIL